MIINQKDIKLEKDQLDNKDYLDIKDQLVFENFNNNIDNNEYKSVFSKFIKIFQILIILYIIFLFYNNSSFSQVIKDGHESVQSVAKFVITGTHTIGTVITYSAPVIIVALKNPDLTYAVAGTVYSQMVGVSSLTQMAIFVAGGFFLFRKLRPMFNKLLFKNNIFAYFKDKF